MALRVLIAGATGAIGSAMLKALVTKGHEVTAIVRDEEKGQRLVASHGTNCKYVTLTLSITSGAELQRLATGFDCTIQTLRTTPDVEETTYKALLSAAAETAASGRNAHFIFVSGCRIYGDCGEETIDESHSTENSLQAAKHRIGFEREILAAGSDRVVTTVLRPGWIYPGSYIEEYLVKTRSLGRVVAPTRNNYLCVIHSEDLAALTAEVVDRRSSGIFNVAETNSLKAHDFADSVSALLSLPVEKVEDILQRIPQLGFFVQGLGTSLKMECRAEREMQWKARNLVLELRDLVGNREP